MRGVRVCATELDAHDTFRIFIKKIKKGRSMGGHVSVRVGRAGPRPLPLRGKTHTHARPSACHRMVNRAILARSAPLLTATSSSIAGQPRPMI